MRKASHYLSSTSVSLAVGTHFTDSIPGLILFVLGGIRGAMLPDRWEYLGTRFRLIKHRTLTHWLLLWILIPVGIYSVTKAADFDMFGWINSLIFGIVCGTLTHILCDMMTMSGVPVFLPTERSRMSLQWIKNGTQESLFVILLMLGCGLWTCLAFPDGYWF